MLRGTFTLAVFIRSWPLTDNEQGMIKFQLVAQYQVLLRHNTDMFYGYLSPLYIFL